MSDVARARARADDGVIPVRPLTVGEVLDGAVALLRTRGRVLVLLGILVAAAEQALLLPLRARADQDITMLPGTGLLRDYGVLVVVGFATEAAAISTLAAVAATASGRALLGSSAPPSPRVRPLAVAGTVVLAGAIVGLAVTPFVAMIDSLRIFGVVVGWLIAVLLWALPYGLTGLAVPATVIEQRGPGSALLRSLRLASRNTLRAAIVRLLGYAGWALVRVALITATIGAVQLFGGGPLPSATWDRVALAAAAFLVNAIAYPVLGCLDTMLLLETRMRTEGLDIALRWAGRRGVTPSLEAPVALPGPGPTR